MTTATNETTNNETGAQVDDGRTIEGCITVVPEVVDHALVVTNPAQYAKDLFEPFFGELTSARRRASAAKYDITTPAGMAAAKLLSETFVKIRTRADKLKVERKKPIDQAGKTILAEYERLATAAKSEQDKHDGAIAAEKARLAKIEADKAAAERVRIEAIEARIQHIRVIPQALAKADAATLTERLAQLVAKQLDPALYEEHLELAITTLNETVDALRVLEADAIKREQEAAELARLRAEEEKRKEEAAETQRKQEAAAAALKAQQDQMTAIMDIQSMAQQLVANEKDKDRAYIEAAIVKVKAFDPATFGAMAPMAALARDAALPPLEALLAALPAESDPVAVEEAASLVETELEARTEVVIEESRLDATESSITSISASPRAHFDPARVPATKRPADLAILEALTAHFGVPALVAVGWLETVDTVQLRDDLKAA